MTRRNIADMSPGERIEDQVFRIQSKDLRTTTQGSLYIHSVLADASGQVPARMWQASEPIFNSMPEGGFMRIRGRTENYKGTLQFIIEGLQPVSADEVDGECVDMAFRLQKNRWQGRERLECRVVDLRPGSEPSL